METPARRDAYRTGGCGSGLRSIALASHFEQGVVRYVHARCHTANRQLSLALALTFRCTAPRSSRRLTSITAGICWRARRVRVYAGASPPRAARRQVPRHRGRHDLRTPDRVAPSSLSGLLEGHCRALAQPSAAAYGAGSVSRLSSACTDVSNRLLGCWVPK